MHLLESSVTNPITLCTPRMNTRILIQTATEVMESVKTQTKKVLSMINGTVDEN